MSDQRHEHRKELLRDLFACTFNGLHPERMESVKNLEYIKKVKTLSENIIIICGFIWQENETYNSAAIMQNNKILSVYNKQYLPNYSVFDEERYFQKGRSNKILSRLKA